MDNIPGVRGIPEVEAGADGSDENGRRVRNRFQAFSDAAAADAVDAAAVNDGSSLSTQPMQTFPKQEISPNTDAGKVINIFERLLRNDILPNTETNMTLLHEAVLINQNVGPGVVPPKLGEKINDMKKILFKSGHVKEIKGGRRRSSSARKSSSRRGRRSSKKRGTQRKQKRRQRRGSRRAY